MNENKTLLTCAPKEFLRQLNSMRNEISEYFKVTGLHDIIYKAEKLPENVTDEEKTKLVDKQYAERYDNVVAACFGEHIDKTYDILAKMSFATAEEIEKLDPADVINLLFKFFINERTMPFFITWRSTGRLNSDD